MKIALINENSQAAKNALIESTLRKVVEPMGHEVVNYGMYTAEDAAQLTYVQNGILAAVLLNSGAADYVITGCGTGRGCHAGTEQLPRCDLRPCRGSRGRLHLRPCQRRQRRGAAPLPRASAGGGELNLEYIFEKLFGFGHGQGYPKERVVPEQRNKEDSGRRARRCVPRPVRHSEGPRPRSRQGAPSPASTSPSISSPPARMRSWPPPSRN